MVLLFLPPPSPGNSDNSGKAPASTSSTSPLWVLSPNCTFCDVQPNSLKSWAETRLYLSFLKYQLYNLLQSREDHSFTHQGKRQTSLGDRVYWASKISIEVTWQVSKEGNVSEQSRHYLTLFLSSLPTVPNMATGKVPYE